MTTKLLCATDGSHASERVVALLIKLVQQLHVPLSFLTVNLASKERTSKTHFWADRILGADDEQISQVLGNAVSAAKQAGLEQVTCVAASGREVTRATWTMPSLTDSITS